LPAYYRAADLYVSPSHSDGSSISLLEALACGRPVLASDIPSNREWVTAAANGQLFRDGSVTDLAAKLSALPDDPNLAAYGLAARAVAESRADWTVNFQKLLQAYDRAVGK
jgi:glycosyltransferase involved in cell wall biosynthesis